MCGCPVCLSFRRVRVNRLTEGYAIAAVDATRTVCTVSRFVPGPVTDGEVVVCSSQLLIAFKRGRHDIWSADVRHRIRLSPENPGSDGIVEKVVRLVNSEEAVPAAGFLQ